MYIGGLAGAWIFRNDSDSHYMFNYTRLTYDDADDSCTLAGGTLASITSLQEQRFLMAQVPA